MIIILCVNNIAVVDNNWQLLTVFMCQYSIKAKLPMLTTSIHLKVNYF